MSLNSGCAVAESLRGVYVTVQHKRLDLTCILSSVHMFMYPGRIFSENMNDATKMFFIHGWWFQ